MFLTGGCTIQSSPGLPVVSPVCPSPSIPPPCFSCKDTCHWVWGPPPIWNGLISRPLITNENTIHPDKITFSGSNAQDLDIPQPMADGNILVAEGGGLVKS